ncbi:HAD-IIIA family hydrolase [Fibrella aestuarina]|nr:HAD-IIIA family hydrolase [Fibrella aestuarina]
MHNPDNFQKKPVLFMDLDGTVRRPKSGKTFNTASDDFELIPGIEARIMAYVQAGYLIVAVTNQGGVAHGHKTEEAVDEELRFTANLFAQNPFVGMYSCPYMEGGHIAEFNWRSLWRKPDYGMLTRAESYLFDNGFIVDYSNSLFVGDGSDDAKCARNARIGFQWAWDFLVAKGTDHPRYEPDGADLIVAERNDHHYKHGWDATDAQYKNGELIDAALFAIDPKREFSDRWPNGWVDPFREKILNKSLEERLAVAGSLIAAQIDHLRSQGNVPAAPKTAHFVRVLTGEQGWYERGMALLFSLSVPHTLAFSKSGKISVEMTTHFLVVSSSPGKGRHPASTIAMSSTVTGKYPEAPYNWVQARLSGEFRFAEVLAELGYTIDNLGELPAINMQGQLMDTRYTQDANYKTAQPSQSDEPTPDAAA